MGRCARIFGESGLFSVVSESPLHVQFSPPDRAPALFELDWYWGLVCCLMLYRSSINHAINAPREARGGRTDCDVLPSTVGTGLHDYSHSISSQLSWCSVTRPPNRSRTLATRCARAASSSDASACPRVCRQPCGAACPVVSWPVARHSRERRRRPRARKPSLAGYTARRCWASYCTLLPHGRTD